MPCTPAATARTRLPIRSIFCAPHHGAPLLDSAHGSLSSLLQRAYSVPLPSPSSPLRAPGAPAPSVPFPTAELLLRPHGSARPIAQVEYGHSFIKRGARERVGAGSGGSKEQGRARQPRPSPLQLRRLSRDTAAVRPSPAVSSGWLPSSCVGVREQGQGRASIDRSEKWRRAAAFPTSDLGVDGARARWQQARSSLLSGACRSNNSGDFPTPMVGASAVMAGARCHTRI
jgi:hypothetical protein